MAHDFCSFNRRDGWVFMRVIEPAAFLMTRRMLIGIKARAEALAAGEGRQPSREA